jgi:UDP-N-acetylglucosamine 2-epimerase (non-hydrolysing)
LFVDVGHVEAGLRSRDRSMPEETNRIVADHLSTCLFAPTETARQNLLAEGIDSSKIFVTGNTIVDAVSSMIPRVESHDASALTKGEGTLLLTLHRQENVDNEDRLRKIMNGLELVSMSLGCGVMFPIHPRTRKQMGRLGLRFDGWLKPLEPMDYISFLALLKRCKMVFTDSGGVQEEACILHVPCVTLRDNTERPETVQVGANVLAGAVPEVILEKAKMMYVIKRDWPNPYGDGRASERIVELVLKHG